MVMKTLGICAKWWMTHITASFAVWPAAFGWTLIFHQFGNVRAPHHHQTRGNLAGDQFGMTHGVGNEPEGDSPKGSQTLFLSFL